MSLIDNKQAIPIATTGHHCPSCTCESLKNPVAPLARDHGFPEFWAIYPHRPGHPKGHKTRTLEIWRTLNLERRRLAFRAAKNHAAGAAGYTKDSQRFLRDDFWRDWVDVDPATLIPPRPPGAPNTAKYDPTKGQWTG